MHAALVSALPARAGVDTPRAAGAVLAAPVAAASGKALAAARRVAGARVAEAKRPSVR